MSLAIPTPTGIAVPLLSRLLTGQRPRAPGLRPAGLALAGTQTLQKGALLVVRDPLHHRVECLAGSVWITHDGDTKDIVLDQGQSYQAESNRRMLVSALTCASLSLELRSR